MKIRNLTPHAISLKIEGEYVTIPGETPVPRVSTVERAIEGEYPFEAYEILYGEIQDLPPEEEGTLLIVSKICADACPARKDLWYPARLVRDEAGRITGCDALGRNP